MTFALRRSVVEHTVVNNIRFLILVIAIMNVSENNNSAASSAQHRKINQNIQVYVRVRPLNDRERSSRSFEVVECVSPREIITRNAPESKLTKRFTFDRTFAPNSRQVDVYTAVVAPYIEEVLAGYNCTVFAYGQTGTGKTHTMIGTESPELKSSWEDDSSIGIIPRALSHLFDELRLMDVEFSMRVSYLELYNEELIDLLSSDDSTKIRIFDDMTKKGSIIIHGLEEIPVHTKDDVYRLLETGKERRRTASTLINAQSSRSHTVFSILVHIRENNDDGEEMLKIGKLNLVDLAGSENISKAGNERGIRTRETVNINQSLLTLGRVITALVERTPHVPYRESKLTRLLQESLGGRTKTSIIATISPGHKDIEETLSTLDYAHRARNIQNKPEVNQKLTKKTVLKEYTEEIDRLKRELMAAREKSGVYLPVERYEEISAQMESQNRELNEKMLLIKALKEEIVKKDSVFSEISSKLLNETNVLQDTRKDLEATKTNLIKTKKALVSSKRRYEEHKVVIETQVKTEAELIAQAQTILKATEMAAKDTDALHKTIERRKVIDKNVQTVVKDYSHEILEKYGSMEVNLKRFQDQHSAIAEALKRNLTFSTVTAEELLDEGTQQIKRISNQYDDSVVKIAKCSSKYRDFFDSLNNDHQFIMNDFLKTLEQSENERTAVFNANLGKLDELNMNVKLLMETLRTSATNLLSKNLTQTENFISCLQTQFTALYESNEINVNAVVKLQKYIDEQKRQERDKERVLKNFFEQMQKDSKRCSANTENITTTRSELERGNSAILERLQQNIEYIEEFLVDCKDKNSQDVANINASLDTVDFHINEHTIQSSSLQKEIESHHNQIVEKVEHLKNEKDRYYLAEQDIWMKRETEAQLMRKEKEKLTKTALNVMESVLSDKVEKIKRKQLSANTLVTQLDSNISDYCKAYGNIIKNCTEETLELQAHKLKTYVPTGETPAKRDYFYPRKLSHTSPHEKIIQRYREEMNWTSSDSTSIPVDEHWELGEDNSSDISKSENFLNSTPVYTSLVSGSESLNATSTTTPTLRESQRKNNLIENLPTTSISMMKRLRLQMGDKENFQDG